MASSRRGRRTALIRSGYRWSDWFAGVDILDGTPVLDIKPYIPQLNPVGDVCIGWLTGRRYHDAKEDLLAAYGIDHEPFEDADQFLKVLRDRVDETISEYRLRA